jgi:hypothetical protein
MLLDSGSHTRAYFDRSYLESLLRRHEGGRELDLHLWTLLSFELWCRQFLGTRTTLTAPASTRPARAAVVGAFA